MKIEYRNNGIEDVKVLIADDNKHFVFKGTDEDWGTEVWCGYIYYKNGEVLPEPYMVSEEDFEEIDEVVVEDVYEEEIINQQQ